jgi:hypothetical protein
MKTIFHIAAGSRHQGSGDAKPDKRGIYSIAAREIPLTFARRARTASSEGAIVANERRLLHFDGGIRLVGQRLTEPLQPSPTLRRGGEVTTRLDDDFVWHRPGSQNKRGSVAGTAGAHVVPQSPAPRWPLPMISPQRGANRIIPVAREKRVRMIGPD